MIELKQVPITIKIQYSAAEYSDSGWALARAMFDDKIVANFEANTDSIEFPVVPGNKLTSCLRLEHYGKNYITDKKYIEAKKIYINNIDLEHIVWDGVQVATLPPWDKNNPVMPGNLYLGHNGYIEWTFKNPLLKDIQHRLNKGVPQINGQETSRAVLEEMKQYFF